MFIICKVFYTHQLMKELKCRLSKTSKTRLTLVWFTGWLFRHKHRAPTTDTVTTNQGLLREKVRLILSLSWWYQVVQDNQMRANITDTHTINTINLMIVFNRQWINGFNTVPSVLQFRHFEDVEGAVISRHSKPQADGPPEVTMTTDACAKITKSIVCYGYF